MRLIFISLLQELDHNLFHSINQTLTHHTLDPIMVWIRGSTNWYPFYVLLFLFLLYKGGYAATKWILSAIVNLILTDQLSSRVLKNIFQRPRPCRDIFMENKFRLLLEHCSSGYSFTSSHAANHFGLAMFITLTLNSIFPKYGRILLILWAATISYAQVYVGVHYPSDILGGGLLGIGVAWVSKNFYLKFFGPFEIIR